MTNRDNGNSLPVHQGLKGEIKLEEDTLVLFSVIKVGGCRINFLTPVSISLQWDKKYEDFGVWSV